MSQRHYGTTDEDSVEVMVVKARGFWDNNKKLDDMGPLTAEQIRAYLVRALSLANKEFSDGMQVLDYGCGLGRLYDAVGGFGVSYWGVDISQDLLQRARSHVPSGGFFLIRSQETVFEDEGFDVVLCYSVLTHVHKKQIQLVLVEIARVLKADGVALVSTKDERYKDFNFIETITHLDFHREIEAAGFIELGTVMVPDIHSYNPDTRFWQTLHCLVKRK